MFVNTMVCGAAHLCSRSSMHVQESVDRCIQAQRSGESSPTWPRQPTTITHMQVCWARITADVLPSLTLMRAGCRAQCTYPNDLSWTLMTMVHFEISGLQQTGTDWMVLKGPPPREPVLSALSSRHALEYSGFMLSIA